MGLADGAVQIEDVFGNLASVGPTGALRAGQDAPQLFFDDFGTGLDTTNNWNAAVAVGGGVAATNTAGSTQLGTGTTANGYSYLQSRPTFRPVSPGWLQVFHAINLQSPIPANAYLFWGAGTVPATPTAAAPLTNAFGFEVTTAGKLIAVCYSAGTRNVIQDLSASTGNATQPTDAAVHKYTVFFRGDLAYWLVDTTLAATLSTGALGPTVNNLPLLLLVVAGSSAPASSGTIIDNAAWVGDTTQARGLVLSDATFPYRQATITAASTAPAATATSLVMAINPNSNLPVFKDVVSSGTITAASSFGTIGVAVISSTVPAAGTFVSFSLMGVASLGLSATGTWTGTLAIEASVDGTNFTTVYAMVPGQGPQTGFTIQNVCRVACAGYQTIRVRAITGTTFTGSVTVTGVECTGGAIISTPDPLAPGFSTIGATAEVDGFKATYSATAVALASAATATDIFTLTGSATKTVRVNRITMSFTGTLSATHDILIVKRSAANTGGTSTTPTAVSHDSTDPAATATVRAYTANPTALGATVGTMRAYRSLVAATGGANSLLDEVFGIANNKAIVVRGTAEVLAVNLNAVTFNGGTFDISITWTEE